MSEAVKVGILITGNEVLSAKTQDTNGPFMGAHLRQFGLRISAVTTCGDDTKDIQDCLGFLATKCDVILMTGGLGPTSDDLTAECVGNFLKQKISFHQAAWDSCVEQYLRMGRTEIPESNRKQALLPESAVLLPNPNGTAVGFLCSDMVEGKSVRIFAMPGVPYEMESMFLDFVLPKLITSPIEPVVRAWQVFYLGESAMQVRLQDVELTLKNRFPSVAISYQAHSGFVSYTVLFSPKSEAEKLHFKALLREEIESMVEKSLGHHIAYAGEEKFAAYICRILGEKRRTLSIAESCTGGFISAEISAIAGASKSFLGGIVSYSETAKKTLLSVKNATLLESGAASCEVAAEMACGVVKQFCSDMSLSVTGIAGPDSDSSGKPVGTVSLGLSVVAAAVKDVDLLTNRLAAFGWKNAKSETGFLTFVAQLNLSPRLKRSNIQLRSAQFALGSLAVSLAYIESKG